MTVIDFSDVDVDNISLLPGCILRQPPPRPIRHKWLLPTPPSNFVARMHDEDADLYVELVADLTQSR